MNRHTVLKETRPGYFTDKTMYLALVMDLRNCLSIAYCFPSLPKTVLHPCMELA